MAGHEEELPTEQRPERRGQRQPVEPALLLLRLRSRRGIGVDGYVLVRDLDEGVEGGGGELLLQQGGADGGVVDLWARHRPVVGFRTRCPVWLRRGAVDVRPPLLLLEGVRVAVIKSENEKREGAI